jgi:hypothetical protein
MIPTSVKGRPREAPHDLCGHIDTLGPYLVIHIDDAKAPAFYVEVTVPTWRVLWLALRNAIPFANRTMIEMKPRGPYEFERPSWTGSRASRH